jgi:hypothetical protein
MDPSRLEPHQVDRYARDKEHGDEHEKRKDGQTTVFRTAESSDDITGIPTDPVVQGVHIRTRHN